MEQVRELLLHVLPTDRHICRRIRNHPIGFLEGIPKNNQIARQHILYCTLLLDPKAPAAPKRRKLHPRMIPLALGKRPILDDTEHAAVIAATHDVLLRDGAPRQPIRKGLVRQLILLPCHDGLLHVE